MKKLSSSIFFTFIVLLMSLGIQTPSPLIASASRTDTHENRGIAKYQSNPKNGLKGVLDWGLAKVEIFFDKHLVSELIRTFVQKANHIFEIMVSDFAEWTGDKIMSYEDLHEKETHRLKQFDREFSDLVKLRNKIERRCIHTKKVEDRSLCIDKEMEIHEKIQQLRSRRLKSSDDIQRYNGWITWCASYGNWVC